MPAPINGNGGDNVLIGSASADVINGNGGDDVIFGLGGADAINGGNGADIVFGGSGADVISGGAGDDFIDGGSEVDTINGGRGDDILAGGAGNDTFVFGHNFGSDLITDLAVGDAIDLTAFAGITDISELTLTEVGPNVIITVPGVNGGNIVISNATAAQVAGQIQVACLVRGTCVQTPAGEVAVENIAIGDLVTTVDGSAKPVKWIGRRAYAKAFIQRNSRVAPVLFAKGALAGQTPARDLLVSPDHAVLVDGALVAAHHLVNGSTVRQVSDFDSVEYFHIEFETPEVIFTEGMATESYADHGNRRMFSNYAEYVDLYGEPIGHLDGKRRFDTVTGGDALDAVRSRFEIRTISNVA